MILPCPCPLPDHLICHLDLKSLRHSIQHDESEPENCLPIRQGKNNLNPIWSYTNNGGEKTAFKISLGNFCIILMILLIPNCIYLIF